jgi:hypothetical protein
MPINQNQNEPTPQNNETLKNDNKSPNSDKSKSNDDINKNEDVKGTKEAPAQPQEVLPKIEKQIDNIASAPIETPIKEKKISNHQINEDLQNVTNAKQTTETNQNKGNSFVSPEDSSKMFFAFEKVCTIFGGKISPENNKSQFSSLNELLQPPTPSVQFKRIDK